MTLPIPDALGICQLCFEPVWAGSSYLFIKDGQAVHHECFLRQPPAFRQETPWEPSPFKNEWRKGRIAWRCPRCKKSIWLEPKIYEKVYRDSENCLDCRTTKFLLL
ncbi:hypothetical protein N752_00955 [Desulforamulus aquiferis]|nr:hypothetical protein N752_00955 [Desulforamulus aquiferis]